jgi:hypothetical protein
LERSWFAAQIARFTASGAFFGAHACPKRRQALPPVVTGPDVGNDPAIAGGTIEAKAAAAKNILGLE